MSAVVPLGAAAVITSEVAEAYHLKQARELYALQARGLAAYTATWLGDLERSARLSVDFWMMQERTPAQTEALQRVLYAQFDALNIVWTVDADGLGVAPATRVADPIELVERGFNHHQSVSDARLAAFEAEIPLSEALASGVALGRVYTPPEALDPVVPLALSSQGSEQLVAVEVSLSDLAEHFSSQALAGGAAVLLADGTVIGEDRGLVEPGVLQAFVGDLSGELQYEHEGEAVVASFHPVPGTSWKVLVAVPAAQVAEGVEAIRVRYLYVFVFVMLFALGVGAVAASRVSRPIAALREGALKLGAGRLGLQVRTQGSAEVQELAEAFNSMSLQLKENAEEIEAFNAELQQRVEERTAELRESQDRLVQTSRMAAVAQMGAGLAHELNNPIAGILGLAQVASLQAQGPTRTMLSNIEEQAQRCRDILASLNRFSGAQGAAPRVPVELGEVLADVLQLVGSGFEQAGVGVEVDLPGSTCVLGDAALLGQALAQLLRSLRTRLGPGGRLRVDAPPQERVLLRFHLLGQVLPEGDDWLASGMGFWVARQVFQDHGGRLREPSEGQDPVYTLELPRHPAA